LQKIHPGSGTSASGVTKGASKWEMECSDMQFLFTKEHMQVHQDVIVPAGKKKMDEYLRTTAVCLEGLRKCTDISCSSEMMSSKCRVVVTVPLHYVQHLGVLEDMTACTTRSWVVKAGAIKQGMQLSDPEDDVSSAQAARCESSLQVSIWAFVATLLLVMKVQTPTDLFEEPRTTPSFSCQTLLVHCLFVRCLESSAGGLPDAGGLPVECHFRRFPATTSFTGALCSMHAHPRSSLIPATSRKFHICHHCWARFHCLPCMQWADFLGLGSVVSMIRKWWHDVLTKLANADAWPSYSFRATPMGSGSSQMVVHLIQVLQQVRTSGGGDRLSHSPWHKIQAD
jgi:hypothetical protein